MDPHDLSTAFSVWAAVVLLVGGAIVFELTRIRNEMRELRAYLNTYVVDMEKRVTSLETHMEMHHGFTPRR